MVQRQYSLSDNVRYVRKDMGALSSHYSMTLFSWIHPREWFILTNAMRDSIH